MAQTAQGDHSYVEVFSHGNAGPTGRILIDVLAELDRAERKFPDQHVPDGTPPLADRYPLDEAKDQADRTRDMHRRMTDDAARLGRLTWRHILAEEFFEAIAEHDPAALRAELIQVAAVAIRWINDLDRRAGQDLTPDTRIVLTEKGEQAVTEGGAVLRELNEPIQVRLPEPGTPGYDPDVHLAAQASRARQAGQEDH